MRVYVCMRAFVCGKGSGGVCMFVEIHRFSKVNVKKIDILRNSID